MMCALRDFSCAFCVSGTTTSGEARGAEYCACSVHEVCCQNSMSVSSSGQCGELANENIRRAFDSIATERDSRRKSGGIRCRGKSMCGNAFFVHVEMRDCGIVCRGLAVPGAAVTLCTSYRYSDYLGVCIMLWQEAPQCTNRGSSCTKFVHGAITRVSRRAFQRTLWTGNRPTTAAWTGKRVPPQ